MYSEETTEDDSVSSVVISVQLSLDWVVDELVDDHLVIDGSF